MKRHLMVSSMAAAAVAVMGTSPYISKVYEFCPAPGQFVNEVPLIEASMSREDVLHEVEAQICGNDEEGATPGMISLGAFGGYVVFGFDHPLLNVKGQPDMRLYGNAFRNQSGMSAEPGIVMVSVDANGNGTPDDEWFELEGSESGAEGTQRNFEVTYYRPSSADEPIRWTSSDPLYPSGELLRVSFHTQSYWPEWEMAETLTFRGTRLPSNAREEAGRWILEPYAWGYVDNSADNLDFDLDNAVDSDGRHVELTHVDFVKVYTAVLQNCGSLGEVSTELRGGEDLHAVAQADLPVAAEADREAVHEWFDLNGRRVSRDVLRPGIYLWRRGSLVSKIVVR